MSKKGAGIIECNAPATLHEGMASIGFIPRKKDQVQRDYCTFERFSDNFTNTVFSTFKFTAPVTSHGNR